MYFKNWLYTTKSRISYLQDKYEKIASYTAQIYNRYLQERIKRNKENKIQKFNIHLSGATKRKNKENDGEAMPEKKCLEKVSCHIVKRPVMMAVI